jgi:phenylacetaldehyde dehydrogenase
MIQVSSDAEAFLARAHGPIIGGQTVAGSGAVRDILDPATGVAIARISETNAHQVDLAVRKARLAFKAPSWAGLKPNERARMISRLADLLEDRANLFAEIESLNTGMPVRFARSIHVTAAVDLLRYMSGWPTKLCGETVPVSSPGDWHAYTLREPVGVVGQIVPWNAPLLMAVWKIAPALATGCTVVLKPAEHTPLTALLLAELCLEAGLPEGSVNVVPGDGTVGAALAAHPDVDKVAFTGSTAVGRAILRAAADTNLKKVSLELGGKSPVILFDDCDVEAAIPAVAAGIFSNAGQICNAGSRVYVHERIFDRIVEGVAQAADALKLGHGLDPASQMGPLISAAQLRRVETMTAAGIREGAEVITGGRSLGGPGYFFCPTVLSVPEPSLSVAQEEIFGPVLSVLRVRDDSLGSLAEAANDSPYGLAASVFTRDIRKAHLMARYLRAGVVGINRHVVADNALPFGGYKQSGWGRERGREVLDLYTEIKSVAVAL